MILQGLNKSTERKVINSESKLRRVKVKMKHKNKVEKR